MGVVYFISDAHLGVNLKGAENREKDLICFLKEITSSASDIFIVGDLFDFWIDYKHAIRPCYIPILNQFINMIDAGVNITYIAGNHDFALGNFLENTTGIKTIQDDLSVNIQGKRVYIRHGDGVISGDTAYLILKKLLRNRFLQAIYKLLHPNIGVPLGTMFSGSSRHFSSESFKKDKEQKYLTAADKFLAAGNDIIVMGHTHMPALYERKQGIYCNTGEWINKYSYAKMVNGKISLESYK